LTVVLPVVRQPNGALGLRVSLWSLILAHIPARYCCPAEGAGKDAIERVEVLCWLAGIAVMVVVAQDVERPPQRIWSRLGPR